ncbi:MAG: DUF885 domain-containing protein [Chloroflexi bacterium]|nr:DUF885 domain-containing protein [Chloroflexota bacterium]MDA1227431.1 DUF885 domain-containing protein [Chloroflexota bacterium]
MTANEANRLFQAAMSDILEKTWQHYPDLASGLGLHQYDGKLPDISRASLADRTRELQMGIASLENIDNSALSYQNYYDHQILLSALRKELLELTELKWQETNPMGMIWHIGLSHYVQRDYAPLNERVTALISALRAVPKYLSQLRELMARPPGKAVIEASIEAYNGVKSFYQTDLVDAVAKMDDPEDKEIKARFTSAKDGAVNAVADFVDFLKSAQEKAPDKFAIGSEGFSKLLKHGEMVDLPLERLLEIGIADLEGNLARFRELASQVDPGKSPAEVMAGIAGNHPAADELISYTRDMLEDIRQYLLDNDIVSVPSDIRCITTETPSFMRWAFAALDSPGPYEEKATQTYYYVTPVENDWTDEQKEQWLTSFNYATLRAVSVHEAYPGHYVQYLHTKKAASKIGTVFGSYSFSEGWAHYTEQMMIEEGYGADDPRNALGQLMEALLRDCRYICAIRMHTQGMTLDEATTFFIDNAFMEELPARKEASRGTFDPMYLNYTLGKLMILKLREDFRNEKGDKFSLKEFHDTFLSFGAPPIPLVREMMLRDAGDGAL